MYPGIEYNNARLADFANVRNYKADSIKRDQPRLPWHDVALRVEGRVVTDIWSHFIEYGNNSYFEQFVVEDYSKEVAEMSVDEKEEEKKVQVSKMVSEEEMRVGASGTERNLVRVNKEKEQEIDNTVRAKILARKSEARKRFNEF